MLLASTHRCIEDDTIVISIFMQLRNGTNNFLNRFFVIGLQ